ncbi:hypothetical protein [Thalassobaculum fulvum]|uniref:hypothetical protein n=1 Tax=Thalassobaculum fulvum TaxID=1633335 RepID=UPI0016788AF8|nr:hypothetical protein [Thalassobaculum fulvum]
MRRRRSTLLAWLIRLAVLAAVVAGLLAVLWGARLACGANPGCPWSTLWRTR